MLPITKIVNRMVLNGSSTPIDCSAIARAATEAANAIAGTQTGGSRRREGPWLAASRMRQIAISVSAALRTNHRSASSTLCASDGIERIRKLLTVQFAQQLGSKYGSLNSARATAASTASRYTTPTNARTGTVRARPPG